MLHRTTEHAIISLRPNLVDAFLAGDKCVEIRRRAPLLAAGTFVWLYSKVPCGKVMAVAKLQCVRVKKVSDIWQDFGDCAGIDWAEYDSYVGDLEHAAVLIFDAIYPLENPIELTELKKLEPGFHPPQFFRRVRSGDLLDWLMGSPTNDARASCIHASRKI